MKKFNRKLFRFFKKNENLFTFISGILILLAFIVYKFYALVALRNILYLFVVVLCGLPILQRAISGLKYKAIGIEVLVSIAVIAALFIGEYTESAMVTFLFQLGSYLEERTLKKTRSSIKILTQMAPETALLLDQSGEYSTVDVDEVEVNDLLLVKVGSKIPVDGFISSGEGYFNEASINGESKLAFKEVGDRVFAGTILDSGLVKIKATRVGEDTTFSKIIELVEEAQDAKSPEEKFINRFAKYYTPAVIVLSIFVYIFTRSINTAITVLVLACPGALVIGAPVANVAGIGTGAKNHILLKGGESISNYAKSDIFIFDKTGTLTEGKPNIVDIFYYTENQDYALRLLASIENSSDHPLAKSITNYAKDKNIDFDENILTNTHKGLGMSAVVENKEILVGNERLMNENNIFLTETQKNNLSTIQSKGGSVVILSENKNILMIVGISDKIKANSSEMIKELKSLGVKKTVMLTGDNEKTAESVGDAIGIDDIRANLLPEDKLNIVKDFQKEGYKVAFVGDGINDSPALSQSNTGIAMGGGTDVAIEISDVVLIKSDLESVTKSFYLAKKTMNIMKQNIVVAIGTVIFLILGLFLGYVHMAIGMLVHEASILAVILNAMRLLYSKRNWFII